MSDEAEQVSIDELRISEERADKLLRLLHFWRLLFRLYDLFDSYCSDEMVDSVQLGKYFEKQRDAVLKIAAGDFRYKELIDGLNGIDSSIAYEKVTIRDAMQKKFLIEIDVDPEIVQGI